MPLQLQGGFPSNMDQYILEQLCSKFDVFIIMWTIFPKSTRLLWTYQGAKMMFLASLCTFK